MPEYMELFVKVRVNSEEEATRLAEANYNGLLSDMLEMWLKYGTLLMPSIPPEYRQPEVQQPRQRDPDIQLQKVETTAGVLKPTPESEKESSTPRPRGLAGRGRMRRA